MNQYENPDFLFSFGEAAMPTLAPAPGSVKLWELEEDNAYMKYLCSQVTRQISEFVEEQCDQMEYEGSLMYDMFPDKTALQITAAGIEQDFRKKYPDAYPEEGRYLRDMIEVLYSHEIMYRRSRYRTHKRLYI